MTERCSSLGGWPSTGRKRPARCPPEGRSDEKPFGNLVHQAFGWIGRRDATGALRRYWREQERRLDGTPAGKATSRTEGRIRPAQSLAPGFGQRAMKRAPRFGACLPPGPTTQPMTPTVIPSTPHWRGLWPLWRDRRRERLTRRRRGTLQFNPKPKRRQRRPARNSRRRRTAHERAGPHPRAGASPLQRR